MHSLRPLCFAYFQVWKQIIVKSMINFLVPDVTALFSCSPLLMFHSKAEDRLVQLDDRKAHIHVI